MRGAPLLVAVALGACSVPPAAPVVTPEPAAYVWLERGPCFGRCPVYRVAMNARGEVTFEGRRDVAQPGHHERPGAPADFAGLMAELSRLGAFDLDKSYGPGDPHCRQHATDNPVVRFEAGDGQRRISVRHDLGCRDAPAQLRAIEQLIDQRTGAGTWVRSAPEF